MTLNLIINVCCGLPFFRELCYGYDGISNTYRCQYFNQDGFVPEVQYIVHTLIANNLKRAILTRDKNIFGN